MIHHYLHNDSETTLVLETVLLREGMLDKELCQFKSAIKAFQFQLDIHP